MKFEKAIRAISMMMINREYEKAAHHIKRIWKHRDEMTDVEREVLAELAMSRFLKY